MLLNQEWKIALNKERTPYLLFNVHEDLHETNNLAGLPKMKAIEDQLTEELSAYLKQTQI